MTIDWDVFARRIWERKAMHYPGASPRVKAPELFHAIVEACAPFRSGTLLYAQPDVRFYVGHSQVRAPGALLPTSRDRSIARYLQRATTELGDNEMAIVIEHPLCLDFGLWSTVSVFVRDAFRRIGQPALPVVCDLTLGSSGRSPRGLTKREDHAVFYLVLEGRARVSLWKDFWGSSANETSGFEAHGRPDVSFEANAGDLVYWPSRYWAIDESENAVVLRLWVPTASASVMPVIKDALFMLMNESLDESHVPYLPFQPPRRRRGDCTVDPGPLLDVARMVETIARGREIEDTLRVMWSRRVSASGLEPVPPPRAAAPLARSSMVRLLASVPIVRVPFDGPESLWAVNGHAFAVREDAGVDAMLLALADDRPHPVGELVVGQRGASRARAMRLLEELHACRALDVVELAS